MFWRIVWFGLLSYAISYSNSVLSPYEHRLNKDVALKPDHPSQLGLLIPKHSGEHNWTQLGFSSNASFPYTSWKREKRSTFNMDADDFPNNPPPTLDTNTCTSTTKEIEDINRVLFNAFMAITNNPTTNTTRIACSSYKWRVKNPPFNTKCQELKNYLRLITNKIVCENAILQRTVVYSPTYLAMEAKYEQDMQNLNSVVDKMKQSHLIDVAELKSDYNQRLQLLQETLNKRLEEIKELKRTIQREQVDSTAALIRAGSYSEAVEKYKTMKVSWDYSLPSIITKAYSRSDSVRIGHICQFIRNLRTINEDIIACRALYEKMSDNNDLYSLSILLVNKKIKDVTGDSNFGKLNVDDRRVANDLLNKIESKANSVLSSLASNIRAGQYSQVVSFADTYPTSLYFLSYVESLFNGVYTGKGSVNVIIGLSKAFKKLSPATAWINAALRRMKSNNDIYSQEGLQLIYRISRMQDSSGIEEIPSSLNIFGKKKCVLKNLNQNYEFLTATYIVTGERRLVVTHPNSWHEGNNAKWIIYSEDYGKSFHLFNVEYLEYLYAASDHYKYDSDRRSVFTWVPGSRVTQSSWELFPTQAGNFRIKNKAHGEHLYAPVDQFKYQENFRRVFTWGKKQDDYYEMYWKIICS